MDDHLFYLLELYYNAGDRGIEWTIASNENLNSPEYTHLKNSATSPTEASDFINRYTDHKYEGGQINIINQAGIDAYNYQTKIRAKEDTNKEISVEKLNLEMQKLRSENIKLADELTDFPKIRRQRNIAFFIAIIGILLTLISVWISIAQYLKCK